MKAFGVLLVFAGQCASADICQLVKDHVESKGVSNRDVLVTAVLAVWHGHATLLSPNDFMKERHACVVWVDGAAPPKFVQELVYDKTRRSDLSATFFSIAARGRLEVTRRFQRSAEPPYVGNGFGPHGAYKYRIVVRRWLRVEELPKSR